MRFGDQIPVPFKRTIGDGVRLNPRLPNHVTPIFFYYQPLFAA
jgi:hypothetical protein